jgi:hypothetical protein
VRRDACGRSAHTISASRERPSTGPGSYEHGDDRQEESAVAAGAPSGQHVACRDNDAISPPQLARRRIPAITTPLFRKCRLMLGARGVTVDHYRRLAAASAASLLIAAGLLVPPVGASAPASCASGYNPFQVGASFLQQCHVPVFPRLRAVSLPDGGTEYDYMVAGTPELYRVPPPGFDPITASDAALDFYGLPHPPSDLAAYMEWTAVMSRLHWAPAPPYMTVMSHPVSGPRTVLSVKDPDGGGGAGDYASN